MKEENPLLSHRNIAGYLRHDGIWLSESTAYRVLKEEDLVYPYRVREAPWKKARYEPIAKNKIWGTDFTHVLVDGLTYYLTTIIDFYSRYIIAWGLLRQIKNLQVRELIDLAIKDQSETFGVINPTIRSDQGSQYIAWKTKNYMDKKGLTHSFTRTYRPSDNSRTERWYRSFKQEMHYIIGSYPSEGSAKELISEYILEYNNKRPHQALFGFTPRQAHYVYRTKSEMLNEYYRKLVNSRRRRVNENKKLNLDSIYDKE